VGDTVVCLHGVGELVEYDGPEKPCEVKFVVSGSTKVSRFTRADYKKGGARLRRCRLPFGAPADQKTDKTRIAPEVREKVELFYESVTSISPYTKDVVRQRLGVGHYEYEQARIMMTTLNESHAMFLEQFPGFKVSSATFKRLKPWNLRFVERVTCICKQCESFQGYFSAFHKLENTLEPLSKAAIEAQLIDESEDGEEEAVEADGDEGTGSLIEKLLEYTKIEHKTQLVKQLTCEGAFNSTEKMDCIDGECEECTKLADVWLGIRASIVDVEKTGEGPAVLTPEASPLWLTKIEWQKYKNVKIQVPGKAERKELKHLQMKGTVIEFLDDFVTRVPKFTSHRYTVEQHRRQALEVERNTTIYDVTMDIDYAQNYTTIEGREVRQLLLRLLESHF